MQCSATALQIGNLETMGTEQVIAFLTFSISFLILLLKQKQQQQQKVSFTQ